MFTLIVQSNQALLQKENNAELFCKQISYLKVIVSANVFLQFKYSEGNNILFMHSRYFDKYSISYIPYKHSKWAIKVTIDFSR